MLTLLVGLDKFIAYSSLQPEIYRMIASGFVLLSSIVITWPTCSCVNIKYYILELAHLYWSQYFVTTVQITTSSL